MADEFRVRLNEQRCIGCGLCEENLPEVFAMGDFVATVRGERVKRDHAEQLAIAARDCPVNAITVLSADGAPPAVGPDASAFASNHHDQERKNEEEDGQIGKDNGKNGNITNLYDIQADDAERVQG